MAQTQNLPQVSEWVELGFELDLQFLFIYLFIVLLLCKHLKAADILYLILLFSTQQQYCEVPKAVFTQDTRLKESMNDSSETWHYKDTGK